MQIVNHVKSRRAGVAPLEMVMVLPIFVVLLALMMFVGSVSIQQLTLANQVRHETWRMRDAVPPKDMEPLDFFKTQGKTEKSDSQIVKTGLMFDKWNIETTSRHILFQDTWNYRTETSETDGSAANEPAKTIEPAEEILFANEAAEPASPYAGVFRTVSWVREPEPQQIIPLDDRNQVTRFSGNNQQNASSSINIQRSLGGVNPVKPTQPGDEEEEKDTKLKKLTLRDKAVLTNNSVSTESKDDVKTLYLVQDKDGAQVSMDIILEWEPDSATASQFKWKIEPAGGWDSSSGSGKTSPVKWTQTNTREYTVTAWYEKKPDEKLSLKVVIVNLKLEAPGKMIDVGNGNFAAPVMLNDNHDCNLTYKDTANWNCTINCPDGSTLCNGAARHRELEPIWDLNYIGMVANEKDLLHVKLEIKSGSASGNIKLKLNSGANNVRLWSAATKGSKDKIVDLTKTYQSSDLPLNFYVEGICVGPAELEAEVDLGQGNILKSKKLTVHVVSLVERQGGQRRVINENRTPISFTVEGGTVFDGKFTWTQSNLPGTTLPTIDTKNNSISIAYAETASTQANVFSVIVPELSAYRRYENTVFVSIDGKLTLDRKVRVAQATYQGTPVAATTPARRTEVAGLATPPAGFSNTEPNNPNINDPSLINPDPITPNLRMYSQDWFTVNYTGNGAQAINSQRLQYAPNDTSGNLGQEIINTLLQQNGTWYTPMGANRKVYAVLIFSGAYGFKREDIQSIAEHECQHARQDIAIASDPSSHWRTIDTHHQGRIDRYLGLLELDSECVELDQNGSWRYLNEKSWFQNQYDQAMIEYNNLKSGPTNVQVASKKILQDIYKRVPDDFKEIKRYDTNNRYNWSIRAPE